MPLVSVPSEQGLGMDSVDFFQDDMGMQLKSYAQNFEDVILKRCFREVEAGFYIDIGACDPVVDSVSLAFYELGWRGIHVEPSPAWSREIRLARPDEVVIEAAVTSRQGPIEFHAIPGTGLSTGREEIAGRHATAGFVPTRIFVQTVSLAEVLRTAGDRVVHWLKIDVEGMEAEVIESWGDCEIRPIVLVVESVAPLDQTPVHFNFEELIISRGYIFVYFDGVNRFYLSADHLNLRDRFGCGPNYFDDFSLATSSVYVSEIRSELFQLQSKIDQIYGDVHLLHNEKNDLLHIANSSRAELEGQRDEFQNLIDRRLSEQRLEFELDKLSLLKTVADENRVERARLADLISRLMTERAADRDAAQRDRERLEARLGAAAAELAALAHDLAVEKEGRASDIRRLEAERMNAASLSQAEVIRCNSELTTAKQHLEAERAQRAADLERLNAERAHAAALLSALGAVYASTSWRVTLPLRAVAVAFRSPFRFVKFVSRVAATAGITIVRLAPAAKPMVWKLLGVSPRLKASLIAFIQHRDHLRRLEFLGRHAMAEPIETVGQLQEDSIPLAGGPKSTISPNVILAVRAVKTYQDLVS